MTNKICEICKIEFVTTIKKKVTCSKKCSEKNNYIKHKNTYIENARKWGLNNPEKRKQQAKKAFYKFYNQKRDKFNELMYNQFKKNKKKHNCRQNTNYYRIEILNAKNNECEICKSKENLEIHHIDYNIILIDGFNFLECNNSPFLFSDFLVFF